MELSVLIEAPPKRVFAAWSEPATMARWMAPGDASVLSCDVDFAVGGRYRLHMKGVMLGQAYDVVIGGVYRDISPDRRLSFSWEYEDDSHRADVGNSVVTVTLEPVVRGTQLTLVHEKIATAERRAGHHWGWANCFGKLKDAMRDVAVPAARTP